MRIQTKFVLLVILILGVLVGVAWLAGRSTGGNGHTSANLTKLDPKQKVWGMNILTIPYPFDDEAKFVAGKDAIWNAQIDYLKQANIMAVRLSAGVDNLSYLDDLINKLYAQKIKILLILEDSIGPTKGDDEDKHGYEFSKAIAERYKDKVDYYQLANEIGGSAILNSSYPGISLDQYDPIRLKMTLDFVSGAARAVKEFAPTAFSVLTINSANTAILRAAADRGIKFDIIGWNWFSDFGMDLDNPIINRSSGERYKLLDNLKSFDKSIWLTELAWRGDARDGGEQAQATFLSSAIEIGLKSGFSGFFPFVLVEDVVKLPGYGLLRSKPDSKTGVWTITGPRQAFLTYKAIVKRELGI